MPFLSRCLHLLTSSPPTKEKKEKLPLAPPLPQLAGLQLPGRTARPATLSSCARLAEPVCLAQHRTTLHSSAFLSSCRRRFCCCCLVVSTPADERRHIPPRFLRSRGARLPVRLHSPSLAPAPLASALCQSTRLRLLLFLLLLFLLQLPPLLLTQPELSSSSSNSFGNIWPPLLLPLLDSPWLPLRSPTAACYGNESKVNLVPFCGGSEGGGFGPERGGVGQKNWTCTELGKTPGPCLPVSVAAGSGSFWEKGESESDGGLC